ncbi:ABC transporter permease [Shinella pollutisoli]|uniref:ABC transporter permease n=1 Tax=Shinella pollutisoli TaxID=2250594 RepID=A0ABV7DM15_9HYPH|nr:ABC transporter permease [Shinella pollutisoli]
MALVADKPLNYALRENMRVVSALVVRSAISRFGESRFGFVWILLEPAFYIGVYIMAHTVMRASMPFGDSAVLFILAGIFGFRMSRGVARKAETAIAHNLPLLTYPLVRPMDTIVSAFLLEATIWLIICALFILGLSYALDRTIIAYPGELTTCLLAIFFFAFATATFNATVGALVPRYMMFVNMLNMPLMFISGVFFLPSSFPPELQWYISWNPFLHCVEWFRMATYLDYHPVLDKSYLLAVSTILLTVGLTLERLLRNRIINA